MGGDLSAYFTDRESYLCLPPTRQDLTQGLFYSRDFGEGRGRARAKTRALLDLRVSLAHLVQCEPDEPAGLLLTRC